MQINNSVRLHWCTSSIRHLFVTAPLRRYILPLHNCTVWPYLHIVKYHWNVSDKDLYEFSEEPQRAMWTSAGSGGHWCSVDHWPLVTGYWSSTLTTGHWSPCFIKHHYWCSKWPTKQSVRVHRPTVKSVLMYSSKIRTIREEGGSRLRVSEMMESVEEDIWSLWELCMWRIDTSGEKWHIHHMRSHASHALTYHHIHSHTLTYITCITYITYPHIPSHAFTYITCAHIPSHALTYITCAHIYHMRSHKSHTLTYHHMRSHTITCAHIPSHALPYI